jgi:putative ABC transport system permease protein
MTFLNDLKVALRALDHAKGLVITVVLTLALGIGANAAIFTLVRGVLLRPLVNRDENRLIYIRQSAPGMGATNVNFSVPELQDIRSSVKGVNEFGDFSQMGFTMVGLGEPRVVRGGVVSGNYFEVMGLHPVLGRLVDAHDDGPNAAGVVVLTYRFWSTVYKKDPSVIGKTVRLESIGARTATVIGVLEPSVPYPSETEIICNIVTSPHHLSATMVTGRVHRMTELFGRLAPGVTLEQARAELVTAHSNMVKDHSDAYAASAKFGIETRLLRDQITSRARTILLVLLVAAALVFIIACSNVANLILARSVRREGELAVRAALGASTSALRRALLAESLLLCGAGALLGVLIARPMVSILANYASRFSVRALDLTVDSSMLWVGAGLALVAAVLLAFVPRLPSADSANGIAASTVRVGMSGSTSRRLRIFAITQIAASFLLLAGASVLVKTLLVLQYTQTGLDTDHVLVFDVPPMMYGKTPEEVAGFYREVQRRVAELPGVNQVAVGSTTPWRDAGSFGPGLEFSTDGRTHAAGEEDPRGLMRAVSPGYFSTLGVPIVAGRDFNASDTQTKDAEPVVIISQSVAQLLFPNQDPINRHIRWTDPVIKFIPGFSDAPRRVVGVIADIDDEHVIPQPTLAIYSPFEQFMISGRLFVHTATTKPYGLVTPITRIIHGLSTDQPVEHPATLSDIRAEMLTSDRLNSIVFGGFALVALAIAVVGVAGVLAFSVSARMREFGIRLAIGSQPNRLLAGVIGQGAVMAGAGIVTGAVFGYALEKLASRFFLQDVQMPSVLPVAASALILLAAAVIASALPAARAARVDVMQALRTD